MVGTQASNECSAKSFKDDVNDCEERDLTSTVARHGAPSPNPVTSKPISVNSFVSRFVLALRCASKVVQPPVEMGPPSLNPQTSPVAPPPRMLGTALHPSAVFLPLGARPPTRS